MGTDSGLQLQHRPMIREHFVSSGQENNQPLNREDIIAVPQGANAIVSADRGLPVVATTGVLTCYAVALYNPETHTVALAHIDAGNDEAKVINDMATTLRAGHPNQRLVAHVVGGFDMGNGLVSSQEQGADIMQQLRSMPNVRIDTIDTGGDREHFYGIRGLAVDARTGRVHTNEAVPEDIISGNDTREVEMRRSGQFEISPVVYDRGISYLPVSSPVASPSDPAMEALQRLLSVHSKP